MAADKVKQGQLLRKHKLVSLMDAFVYLEEMATQIPEETLKKLALTPLSVQAFRSSPAARNRHQAFAGGLLLHTAQVVQTALAMLTTVADARISETIVGGIWHDYGKIYSYERVGEDRYDYTENNILTGHLSMSNALFIGQAIIEGCTDAQTNFISHLILSHHGRMDWGSPIEPKCAEAYALHAADMLSAQFVED